MTRVQKMLCCAPAAILVLTAWIWVEHLKHHKPLIYDLSSSVARQKFLKQNHFSLQGGVYELDHLVEMQVQSGPKSIALDTSFVEVDCDKNKVFQVELTSQNLSRDDAYSEAKQWANRCNVNVGVIDEWYQWVAKHPSRGLTATSNQDSPESYIVEIINSYDDEKPFNVRVGAAWQLAH